MSAWSFVHEGFEPAEERTREALCALGNGYFVTRGAAPEAQDNGVHYPGTYVAGCYNRLCSKIDGQEVENEDLVNVPNWLLLRFRVAGGAWFDCAATTLLTYRQELDTKNGILSRSFEFRDADDRRTRVASRCFVHMDQPHLAAVETTFTPLNWSGQIEILSALDGRVRNRGVARYRDLRDDHLAPLETAVFDDQTVTLKVQTTQSLIQIAQAARTRVRQNGDEFAAERRLVQEPGFIGQEFALHVAEGGTAAVEKVVALYTSADHAIAECGLEARNAISRAGDFEELLQSHTEAWDFLWDQFDIEIDAARPEYNSRAQRILRLHLFHLLQTTSLHSMDLDVGAGARGLHGEAYRGHVFWDELFIFPILNLRMPEITRALLMYRYRRLDEARAAARRAGFRGAMYPWQSGSNGREESQRLHYNPMSGRWNPDNSHLQRHVNAAIAFNIWQYYQVTEDLEFLTFYGAEMILEIARLWASLATYNPHLDRYEILGVIGPDEYHDGYPDREEPGIDNNAYTNLMAVWTLTRAIMTLELLPTDHRRRLCARLHLHEEEIAEWDTISRRMRLVFHGDGIISQFEHYGDLKEFDWTGYRKKYGDIHRLDRILEAEGDTPNAYQASKQADVLMLFYLFSSDALRELFERLDYPFEHETIPKTIDYYIERTSHGSTLSRLVHSWVLARSDRARSWSLFVEALESDVADSQGGTTAEGIHLGAMAGTADLVQRCYSGMEARGGVLWFNPSLPEDVARLRFKVRYRGHSLAIELCGREMVVEAVRCSAESISLGIGDRQYELTAGETKKFDLTEGRDAAD